MKPRAGGIVVNPEGKIALVWQNGNSWSFPKGGVDEGETPLQAAEREIWEETGIRDLVFVEDLGSYSRHALNMDGSGEDTSEPPSERHMFLFTSETPVLAPQEPDATEARWVTLEEAAGLLTHPTDKNFLLEKRATIEACLN